MATTGWDQGPFLLDSKTITSLVTKTSPGAYALGHRDSNGAFYIDYVGRSDNDLANRLQSWVGKYQVFKAGYFTTAIAAFEKECHLYHDFNPKDNKIHPDRPQNSKWSCPVCNIFD